MTTTTARPPFAAQLAEATAGDHRNAEASPFVRALMSRALPLAGYVDLLVQYRHVYAALEESADALATEPSVAPFLVRALDRVPALDADLADLTARAEVAGASFSPTATTVSYAERIRAVASSSPPRYVAHHYTRYLGDLSGGFPIGRVVAAAYDLSPDHGGRFARFADIDDPAAFKDRYRTHLDEAPWDDQDRQAVIDEAHRAYRCNVDLFARLDHHAG